MEDSTPTGDSGPVGERKSPRTGADNCERKCDMKLMSDVAMSVYQRDRHYFDAGKWGQAANARTAGYQSAQSADSSTTYDENAVLLDMTEDVYGKEEKDEPLGFAFALSPDEEEKDEENEGSGLDDPTARLTKRLVTAKTRDEVTTIMSEAYKALGEALKAAASGDEDAIAVVRRLNKLIRRVTRKIKDLDGEAELRRKEKSAEKKELEQLARQHAMELKRRIAEREKREKKYLQDPDAQDEENENPMKISLGSLSKAELERLMRQMMPAAVAAITSGISSGAGADTGAGLGSGTDGAGGTGGDMSGDAAAEGEVATE